MKYAQVVKDTYKPEVSDQKRKELEELKQKIHTLPLYIVKEAQS
jgi:hypothetical protein